MSKLMPKRNSAIKVPPENLDEKSKNTTYLFHKVPYENLKPRKAVQSSDYTSADRIESPREYKNITDFTQDFPVANQMGTIERKRNKIQKLMDSKLRPTYLSSKDFKP